MVNGPGLGERNWGLLLLWIYTCEETNQERHAKQQSTGSKIQKPAWKQPGMWQALFQGESPVIFFLTALFLVSRGCVPYREQ